LRVGELVCLKYEDFDWENAELCVQRMERRKMILAKNGKMTRSDYEVVDHLKANHDERIIPIADGVSAIVDFIHQEQSRAGIDSDYLFVRTKDHGRQHKEAADKALKRICKALGLEEKTGIHEIRRTWCSNLFESESFTEREIQLLMGHKDIATTKRYYDKSKKKKSKSSAECVTGSVGINLSELWANVG